MQKLYIYLFPLILVACQTITGPKITGETVNKLTPQDGFRVTYYAKNIGEARFMAISPDKQLCVAISGKQQILKLIDMDSDGIVDSQQVIAGNLPHVHSLQFLHDTLYAAGMTTVWRLLDTDDDGIYETKDAIVDDLPSGGHWTRTLVIGPDRKMYVSIGSSCNVCKEADPRRAAIVRYNLDGSGEEVFASGLRNAVGIIFRPSTDHLWGTVNGRDNLHDDLPPEEVLSLQQDGFYGWPYAYGQKVTDLAHDNYQAAASSNPPDIELQAHVAPLGLDFYTGNQFPPDYQGDLFVALHGSWNRSVPVGAKIVRLKVDATGQAAVQDFITGWQDENGNRWGRPADVITGPNGELFISDDDGGYVYRVTYIGGAGEEYLKGFEMGVPSPQTFSDETEITYTLPAYSSIDLRVYDHPGHIIRMLQQDTVEAGMHQITWDGANDKGNSVKSGEYVIQIRAKAGDQFFQRTYPVEKQ